MECNKKSITTKITIKRNKNSMGHLKNQNNLLWKKKSQGQSENIYN